MSTKHVDVDKFLNRTLRWKEEFSRLRSLLLSTPLTEDFRWKNPCYTFNKANIIIMHGFRDYCALLFIKGALLKDPEKILIRLSDNVQAGRQIRFTCLEEIINLEPVILEYINEAVYSAFIKSF